MLLNFLTDETKVTVDVQADGSDWRLVIDGQEVPLQAERDRQGGWLVETHQGRRRLWVARRGDERLVFCDGRVHSFRLHDPDAADDQNQPGGGPNLVADMPGRVVKVVVKAGETIEAGQTVLVIESMKMETEISAAVAGTIKAVHVEDGQLIGQGDPLLDIEPQD